jgi:hypothetical protein
MHGLADTGDTAIDFARTIGRHCHNGILLAARDVPSA